MADPSPCGADATCVNNEGSFVCNCSSGFTENPDGLNCTSEYMAVRLLYIGTLGYRLVFKPVDIDECALGTDNCEQICEDFPGTFRCNCRNGFSINSADISRCDPSSTL